MEDPSLHDTIEERYRLANVCPYSPKNLVDMRARDRSLLCWLVQDKKQADDKDGSETAILASIADDHWIVSRSWSNTSSITLPTQSAQRFVVRFAVADEESEETESFLLVESIVPPRLL